MDYQCLVDNMKVLSTLSLVYSHTYPFISVTIQEDRQVIGIIIMILKNITVLLMLYKQ